MADAVSPVASHLSPGRVEDDYELMELLGSGAFADVFKARHRVTNQIFAVKRIQLEKVLDTKHLLREVAILKGVSQQHKGINTLEAIFESPKTLDLVLEYCAGGELFDQILEKGHYSEDEARDVVEQILSALAFLHASKVCHRDLKPENLLCAENADGKIEIRVADFGLGRFFDDEQNIMNSLVGTPEYAAPEILKGETYNEKVDLWSLGVVTYVLLTGFLPFSGDNKSLLFKAIISGVYDYVDCPDVSEAGKNFVARLLVVDPEKRASSKDALTDIWITQKKSGSRRMIKTDSFNLLVKRTPSS